MKVLGYHVSNNGIAANSEGQFVTEPPYLDFLLEQKEDMMKVLYHIGYNVASLLKLIELTEKEAIRKCLF